MFSSFWRCDVDVLLTYHVDACLSVCLFPAVAQLEERFEIRVKILDDLHSNRFGVRILTSHLFLFLFVYVVNLDAWGIIWNLHFPVLNEVEVM